MLVIKALCPSQGSFLDPTLTKDGKPYGPHRFKEIAKERYLISKFINTSYNDVGQLTPIEREYLIEFAADDKKRTEDAFEKELANRK